MKDPNDVSECIMALLFLNVNVDKMDQIITIILNKLVSNNIERLQLVGFIDRLIQKVRVTWSK